MRDAEISVSTTSRQARAVAFWKSSPSSM
jgi:hypothetical protein